MATPRRRRAGRAGLGQADFSRLALNGIHSELARAPLWGSEVEGLLAAELQKDADPRFKRQRAAFERDALRTQRLVIAQLKRRAQAYAEVAVRADTEAAQRALLHVFGPDTTGTGAPWTYSLNWAFAEGGFGAGIGASSNHRTGQFWASHYSTSGWRSAFAGVGFRYFPHLIACTLSLRPYVPWTGWDILNHRVFDPQLGEQRWAVAMGQIGVLIQSWRLDGSDFRSSGISWRKQWDRRELNPSGGRQYEGTTGSFDGLRLDVPASNLRQYALWTVCRADVWADPGFAVATRASSSISCSVPIMVCEEIPF